MTQISTYPAPLDGLNVLGLDESQQPVTVDYRALGIGPEDVPALIRIATDRRYDTATVPLAWAPLHAWRALGSLRAAEAAEPLATLLDRAPEDDWILDDVPRALGLIGAPALPLAARYLAQPEHSVWSRIAAANALIEIGQQHPDLRGDCVVALTDQLRLFATQEIELNAFLICYLLGLGAVESAPVMEEAFKADQVDLSVNGDWEDVQVELGVLPARLTPAPSPWYSRLVDSPLVERAVPTPQPPRKRRDVEKHRRKIAKQSKRRNRRRR